METVKHNPAFAREVGVPPSVGTDFVAADKAPGQYAGGGRVEVPEDLSAADLWQLLRGDLSEFLDRSNRNREDAYALEQRWRDLSLREKLAELPDDLARRARGWAGFGRGVLGATLGLPGDLQGLADAAEAAVRGAPGRTRTSAALHAMLNPGYTRFPGTEDWLSSEGRFALPEWGSTGFKGTEGEAAGKWVPLVPPVSRVRRALSAAERAAWARRAAYQRERAAASFVEATPFALVAPERNTFAALAAPEPLRLTPDAAGVYAAPGYAGGGLVKRLARAVERFETPTAEGAASPAKRAAARVAQRFPELTSGAAADSFAVRTRGGNFDESWLDAYLHDVAPGPSEFPVAAWAHKQLRNYIRKDLGSPTDPLLAVEREFPDLHLPEGTLTGQWRGNTDRLYELRDRMRGADAIARSRAPNYVRDAEKTLRRHEALSAPPGGGAADGPRLTPWGNLSGEALGSDAPGTYIDRLRERDGAEPPEWLTRLNARQETEFPSNRVKRAEDWEKMPDALRIWSGEFGNEPFDSLGFGHVRDYLNAATEPHREVGDWVASSNRNFARHPRYTPMELRDILAEVQRAGRGALIPFRGDQVDRWKRLMDADLHLAPEQLERLSVADAVRRTARWNQMLAAQDANHALARGIKRVHKEYPEHGMRWVELGINRKITPVPKSSKEIPEDYELRSVLNSAGYPVLQIFKKGATEPASQHTGNNFKSLFTLLSKDELPWNREAQEELSAGLNAEGAAMGHCVGGYCDQVAQRGTRIYSLRDKNNRPHVTVEVSKPLPVWTKPALGNLLPEHVHSRFMADTRPYNLESWLRENEPKLYEEIVAKKGYNREDILQIKGKQNAAPVEKYLPFVQDFVQSGQWGRVGDANNAGLRQYNQVFNAQELKKLRAAGAELPVHGWLSGADIQRLHDLITPEALRLKYDARGNIVGPPGYAKGGSVARRLARAVERFEAPAVDVAAPLGRAARGESFEELAGAPLASAVKLKGGNWEEGDASFLDKVGRSVGYTRGELPAIVRGDRPDLSSTARWVAGPLAKYMRTYLGTAEDPVLKLEAEMPDLHFAEGRGQLLGAMALDSPAVSDRQRAMTKTPVLTQWGRAADQAVNGYPETALRSWRRALNDAAGLRELLDVTTLAEAKDRMRAFDAREQRAHPRFYDPRVFGEAWNRVVGMEGDWREKAPDAEIWDLDPVYATRLGFDHVTDYIDAATAAHKRVAEDANLLASGKPHALADGAVGFINPEDGEILGRGADFNAARTDAQRRLRGRRNAENAYELHDAGLTVDPAKLERLSVPDAIRKTAAWNELLARKMEDENAAKMTRGIKRVHKEYPNGYRWVELGAPEVEPFKWGDPLPEGYGYRRPTAEEIAHSKEYDANPYDETAWITTTPKDPRWGSVDTGEQVHSYRTVQGGPRRPVSEQEVQNYLTDQINEARRRAAYAEAEAGLSAEGDAMGHCVGGYCSNVVNGDTRIFSLRDERNRPHITVETRRPSRGEGLHLPNPEDDPDYERFLAAYDDVERQLPDAAARAAWEDVNGPNSDSGQAIGWLRKNHPDVYTKMFAPKPAPERIIQIKGKQNARPTDKYIPYANDFVKSGNWSRVDDLHNTDLVEHNGKFLDPIEDPRWDYHPERGGSFPPELSRVMTPSALSRAGFDFTRGPYSTRQLVDWINANKPAVHREMRADLLGLMDPAVVGRLGESNFDAEHARDQELLTKQLSEMIDREQYRRRRYAAGGSVEAPTSFGTIFDAAHLAVDDFLMKHYAEV